MSKENIEKIIHPNHFLHTFLNPRSIAFFGANEKILTNMGTQQLLNLLDNGYKGKIYPIHPRLEKVLGLKAYKKIKDVPEVPDLAIIVLPARVVFQVFEELGEKGVHNVVLITAGFRETGNKEGEAELKVLAKKLNIRFLGPNCIGFLNTHTYYNHQINNLKINNNNDVKVDESYCTLNCTWVNYPMKAGNVSIASQSGTFACHINFILPERELSMNKAISVGNEANIDLVDCLEYFKDDPTTEVILLYIEEIKRGREFFKVAKGITPNKPIIALYVGGSAGGAKAVSSHTGSMAGNDEVHDGMFKQAGIIRVYSLEALFDSAMAFSRFVKKKIFPRGKRIAVVTNAGGPGATMSDRASRIGFELPQFSDELQVKIRKYLPPTAQAKNPLDYTFSINPAVFFDTVPKLLAKSGEIDAIVIYGAYGPSFFRFQSVGKEFLEKPLLKEQTKQFLDILEASVDNSRRILKKWKVPIIYVNLLALEDKVFSLLNRKGFPTYKMPHQAVNVLEKLWQYQHFLDSIKGQKK